MNLLRRRAGHGIQCGQHFAGVPTRVYRQEAARDPALRVYQKSAPLRHFHKHKIDKRTIGSRHLPTGVRQQTERQAFFLAKILMGIHAIQANSQDHHIPPDELAQFAMKIARLQRSTRRLVLGIEIQDHPLPAEAGETHRTAVLTRQSKVWGRAANRGSCTGTEPRSHQDGKRPQQHEPGPNHGPSVAESRSKPKRLSKLPTVGPELLRSRQKS